MKILIFIALVAIQLGLSSCAYIYSKSDNVAARVETLVSKEKYGLALDTLEFIQPDHFNYAFLMAEKKRIQTLANRFEEKLLTQASTQEQNKHWAEAMKTYDTALGKLPKSKKLQEARKQFVIKRDKYLSQLQNKLLVSKAKTLSKKTATTKEIAQVNPDDNKAKKVLRSHIREIELTTEKLMTCAEDGIKNKDIQLAEECLTLAGNLSATKETTKKIATLHKNLNKVRKKRTKSNKKSIQTISKQLTHVKTNAQLIRYRKEILALYHQDKSNKKIIRLKKQLDIHIYNALKTGIKQGQNLYSQGRIQPALNLWNELQQLAPSNQKLNDYIHRAKRVLKKLHSLSNNPNNIPLPKATN
ncbi:hypothetical protein MNBD_GAMMA23-2336 [hydrothermal vent metagenome]|uniref:Lipoprotein n=1 Tax=hydrothermal vent metagenome TaxID=652676 RepID=A0A3B1APM8_9ZZZZ